MLKGRERDDGAGGGIERSLVCRHGIIYPRYFPVAAENRRGGRRRY